MQFQSSRLSTERVRAGVLACYAVRLSGFPFCIDFLTPKHESLVGPCITARVL